MKHNVEYSSVYPNCIVVEGWSELLPLGFRPAILLRGLDVTVRVIEVRRDDLKGLATGAERWGFRAYGMLDGQPPGLHEIAVRLGPQVLVALPGQQQPVATPNGVGEDAGTVGATSPYRPPQSPALSGVHLDRREKVLFKITREMQIIEIGPSYGPIAPKSAGWNTKVLDHATREELLQKYGDLDDVSRIEEVDFLWQGGPLESAVPTQLHGTFDACIASHVIEHSPDLIAFLRSVASLLTDNGVLSLAIPDRRYMFDYFQSGSTTADVLEAHYLKRKRHAKRSAFENLAYAATRDGQLTWGSGSNGRLDSRDRNLHAAKRAFDNQDEASDGAYVDWHAWYFTPSSFELITFELSQLRLLPYVTDISFPTSGCEFFVTLRKFSGESDAKADDVEARRLLLMKQIVLENAEQSEHLQ